MSRRSKRGNTAVEFALTLPVFTLMVLGMIDVSWLYYHRSALDTAASVGCRAGALVDPGRGNANIGDVQYAAEEALLEALKANGGGDCDSCEVTVTTFGASPGTSLRCDVTRDFTPVAGFVVGATSLSSTMVVRLEYQRN